MLLEERCEACVPGAPAVTPEEQTELGQQIPEWKLITVKDEPRLRRDYRFDSYEAALAFTQKIGELAIAQDHHPSILTQWGKVTVTWWTHAIHGLHRNDYIMAAKSDEVFQTLH